MSRAFRSDAVLTVHASTPPSGKAGASGNGCTSSGSGLLTFSFSGDFSKDILILVRVEKSRGQVFRYSSSGQSIMLRSFSHD